MKKSSFRRLSLKLTVVAFLLIVAILGFGKFPGSKTQISAASSGPPSSHTNAPGEGNCTSCHVSFPLNSGGGQLLITGLPKNYLPNQQIPVTVTLNHEAALRYGFQMTAIDKSGDRIGGYTLPAASPQPIQVISGIVEGHERRYIEHTSDGITPTQFNTKSWNFTFNAPPRRIGKISLFAAGNAADSDGSADGDYIYTTGASMLAGSAVSNYDNDARSDIAVYRPTTGTWYALTSTGNFRVFGGWGLPGDIITPGDYDGDGKADDAVWRPSNATWYFHTNSDSFSSFSFGDQGDVPVAADYDGDLKTDVAVWRPSNATWYMIRSSDLAFITIPFGLNGDTPVPADYDGDAKAEIAVFRPSNATWYMIKSADNSFNITNFGLTGDEPVQGDYDGDGRWDHAVYRPSNSTWYVLTAAQTFVVTPFGLIGDRPAPADFDGDGLTDITVFRNGTWYYLGTEGSTFNVVQFGLPGDIPVPRGYIPQ
ncbi:MAG: FG-GAP repeat domain-containing protein [Pyrinomonadaceae bacterium]